MKTITIDDNGNISFSESLSDDEKLTLAVLFGWIEDTCEAPNGMQVVLYTGIPASSDETLLLAKEAEDTSGEVNEAKDGRGND